MTGPDPQAHARPETPVQRRRADHSRTLSELLERRPDLAGVHALADLADEALRWSA